MCNETEKSRSVDRDENRLNRNRGETSDGRIEGASVVGPDLNYYFERKLAVLKAEFRMVEELQKTVLMFPANVQATLAPMVYKYLGNL